MSARPKITRAARERMEYWLEQSQQLKTVPYLPYPAKELAAAYARDVKMLLRIADRAIAEHPRRNGKGEPCGT